MQAPSARLKSLQYGKFITSGDRVFQFRGFYRTMFRLIIGWSWNVLAAVFFKVVLFPLYWLHTSHPVLNKNWQNGVSVEMLGCAVLYVHATDLNLCRFE